MSESMKPRFTVERDGIERQLAQSQRPPASARSSGARDPLAELARIVGQDDPYQSLLAGEKASRLRAAEPTGLDDLFAVRDEFGERTSSGRDRSSRDGSFPALGRGQAPGAGHQAYPMRAGDPGYGGDPFVHGHDPYAADYSGDDGMPFPQPVEADELPLPRRSRKRFYLAVAVFGVAAVGAGSALVVGGQGRMMGSGDPPLIKATAEPTKIPPESPGGVDIPNQNKQIYERSGQDGQTKVVDREEQPVDIRQATRAVQGADRPEATPMPLPGAAPNFGLGEPRRVRTVSVRPDGTVIGADTPTRQATPTPAPAVAAVPLQPAPEQSPAPEPAPAAATGATSAAAVALRPEARTPSTTPAGPASLRATPATSAGGAWPQVEPEPAVAPRAPARTNPAPPPQVVSPPVQQAAIAPETGAGEGMTGGYAVQLAVRPSENEARAAFQQLQQRYASELGSLPSIIRRAEVNGTTLYRVRVGPLAREDASALCSRLQAAGGQCFVAKN